MKHIGSKEAVMNDNSLWPAVIAVVVVLAVVVCLVVADYARFTVIGVM